MRLLQAEGIAIGKRCLACKVPAGILRDSGFPRWHPTGTAQGRGCPGAAVVPCTPGLPGIMLAPAAPACSLCAWAQLEALLSQGDTDTIERHKENDEGAEGWDLGGRLNELNLSSFADQSRRRELDNCL